MIIIHRKEVLLVLGGKCMEGTKEKKENIPNAAIGLGGVLKIAWPAVFESFFISLAGMIDTLMVSGIGSEAVAAVGLTTQPKFLGLAVFIAMNVAVAAIVARRERVSGIRKRRTRR